MSTFLSGSSTGLVLLRAVAAEEDPVTCMEWLNSVLWSAGPQPAQELFETANQLCEEGLVATVGNEPPTLYIITSAGRTALAAAEDRAGELL